MNIRKVAELTGVSPATVSRVFSRNPGEGNVDLRYKSILKLPKKYGFPAEESLIRF